MRFQLCNSALIGILVFFVNANTSQSQSVIISPVYATANGNNSGAISNIYNHSGLSPDFMSGVTSFDPYIASNPTHDMPGASYNLHPVFSPSYIDLSLGSAYSVENLVLWSDAKNKNKDSSFSFTLLASDDATFTNFTNLGTFTTKDFLEPSNTVPAQVFSLSPTVAEYFRFQINTDGNSPLSIRIGEVAFGANGVSAVPEPATIIGISAAGLGLVGFVRRRLLPLTLSSSV